MMIIIAYSIYISIEIGMNTFAIIDQMSNL